MSRQGWTATGVIEAPLDRVLDALLAVEEGPISDQNAPLLLGLPGAGALMKGATLKGGPEHFTLHYGPDPGGTVEVDRDAGYFAFQGGFKFRAEYRFTEHPRGTQLTYEAINVAPPKHRNRTAVRLQFWLGGKLKIGLRGGLRRIGRAVGAATYPEP